MTGGKLRIWASECDEGKVESYVFAMIRKTPDGKYELRMDWEPTTCVTFDMADIAHQLSEVIRSVNAPPAKEE